MEGGGGMCGVATKALQRRQNKKFSRCLHNKGSRARGLGVEGKGE